MYVVKTILLNCDLISWFNISNSLLLTSRGPATGGVGDMFPSLKCKVTSYVLVPPPHFYYQIYFDWLVYRHTKSFQCPY